ncbi:hypothetical protein Ngar_c09950 [Candidatus Nitrososphaera gargensis Ga9.2]|uniref:Uncharacterized protein n=1 Tax=Nitrososphaera gargensis (strain Ga9.2) TaxID=1237085 RepID=K0IIM1_NITGG|nr:hypothetical protein [Candidatus Nitrososphaera gargensis]AFU57937.1 hypothetical protein Ngar_c09950 [Candidatus Nitrososphaera gargensis Ga9.2]
MLREPPGAKDRANIETALKTYSGMISSTPQMRQGLSGIMMPGGKEMAEMVEFAEKYKAIYTPERAKSPKKFKTLDIQSMLKSERQSLCRQKRA